MHDQLAKKFTEAAEKQENLLKELKQKQHEDKIRRDIQDAFDAIKDTKDKGIGSHAKFHAFKAAMQEYLSSYPLGHPAADLTTDRANELNERAYQSCITYVNRHLKADNGKQSIAHQGTDEGALRKQGTVRILELMKELPEFKNKFELTADNPQIAEEASNAKDKAKNNTNDKRVKLNFNQLKNSLGEHSKTATSKKPEDFHINAYADLNAAINNKNKPQNNNGKRK